MNEIEQKFYDAWRDKRGRWRWKTTPGHVIGPYKVDFLLEGLDENDQKFVVEIDGHEFHKTKEQRSKDYCRERFLQKDGYITIRFTGTEVFLEPDKCADDLFIIMKKFEKAYAKQNH